jgi:hypothetical protein
MNIVAPNPGKPAPDLKFIVIENKQSEPIKFEMSYNVRPPKLRSRGRINTIYDMHDLMSKSLEIIAPLKTDSQPFVSQTDILNVSGFTIDKSIQDYGIYLAPDFPEFLIPKLTPNDYKSSPQVVRNAITWGVVRSEPATVSQDAPFRGTRELKARTREFIAYYKDSGRQTFIGAENTFLKSFTDNFAYVQMKAQYFDNLVQYNIWSKTNYEAERLTEWFEGEYMDNYIGMFREAGIVQMHFDRRVRDDTIIAMKNGYHVRSVLYYIRTERIKPELIRPIKQVELNINVENLQAAIAAKDLYNRSMEDELVRQWVTKNQLGG